MLTNLELEHGQKCLRIWQGLTSLPMVSHHVEFAKAIEAEVHKQDNELIQQMLYVIEAWERGCEYEDYWRDRDDSINAARKRLENS